MVALQLITAACSGEKPPTNPHGHTYDAQSHQRIRPNSHADTCPCMHDPCPTQAPAYLGWLVDWDVHRPKGGPCSSRHQPRQRNTGRWLSTHVAAPVPVAHEQTWMNMDVHFGRCRTAEYDPWSREDSRRRLSPTMPSRRGPNLVAQRGAEATARRSSRCKCILQRVSPIPFIPHLGLARAAYRSRAGAHIGSRSVVQQVEGHFGVGQRQGRVQGRLPASPALPCVSISRRHVSAIVSNCPRHETLAPVPHPGG